MTDQTALHGSGISRNDTQPGWSKVDANETDSTSPPRASLMGLPSELRIQTWEFALAVYRDDHQPRLRIRQDVELAKTTLSESETALSELTEHELKCVEEALIVDVALLCVSRQLNAETTKIFYRVNKFHYSICFHRYTSDHTGPFLQVFVLGHDSTAQLRRGSTVFDIGMKDMSDLRIDYMPKGLHNVGRAGMDWDLAGHISLIARTCTKLRSLTVHLFVNNNNTCIIRVLSEPCNTATALAAVSIRDCFSIVAFSSLWDGDRTMYEILRAAIAPDSCWTERMVEDWPDVGCIGRYAMGIHQFEGQEQWTWDLETSKRLR